MDIKHVLGSNPLRPAYREDLELLIRGEVSEPGWVEFEGGETQIGHEGEGFAFDNERPVHAAVVEPFALGRRLVTCGEWFAFMADDGYQRRGSLAQRWLGRGGRRRTGSKRPSTGSSRARRGRATSSAACARSIPTSRCAM